MSDPPSVSSKATVNPFRAKKIWPPDFNQLSPKHQFRLERKYKRRAQLKWARPRLMIATRLTQYIAIGSVLAYGVFYMDWQNDSAFRGARDWLHGMQDSIWTNPNPPSSRLHEQRRQGQSEQ